MNSRCVSVVWRKEREEENGIILILRKIKKMKFESLEVSIWGVGVDFFEF